MSNTTQLKLEVPNRLRATIEVMAIELDVTANALAVEVLRTYFEKPEFLVRARGRAIAR